jgi:3-(3-hydroxy-phenyl)propionate hydroxylase
MQDVDNLGWKLGLVINGQADASLLDTYDSERVHGADENILNSTRSTDFITPKSETSRIFRDAVLHLSEKHDFARPLVNSGRLSVPCFYDGSVLNSADALPAAPARSRPGAPCPDAPLGDGYLLSALGDGFILLGIDADVPEALEESGIAAKGLRISASDDASGQIAARYLGDAPAAVYLIRPDQHVAARFDAYDEDAMRAALRRATGKEGL